MIRLFVILLCLFGNISAQAAKPSGLDDPSVRPELYTLKSPVEQAQELLRELGHYEGNIDGIVGSDLENAIREYQKKHGLKQTGKVTRTLLSHLENVGRVQALIRRLDDVRRDNQAAARQALLADPRTKKLLEKKTREVADPTRDTTACFEDPTSFCLLEEAVESSRAVFEDDMRDWALGEILAAQVRAGFSDHAMETAARIKDSRLVVAALTNIAITQVHEGKLAEALSGVSLIPMMERRLSVLLEIALVHQAKGDIEELKSTLKRVFAGAQSIEDEEERLQIQIKAAEILAHSDKKEALDLLETYNSEIRKNLSQGAKVTLLRQSASAMAGIGYPEWALKALEEMPDDESRIPVLMAAVRAFLAKGRFEAAERTIQRISADRYRAVVMADLAKALWEHGETDQTMTVLADAQSLAQAIKLPFARNFALSKIADVMIVVASETRDSLQANQAFTTISNIGDDRLKARGMWDLANASQRHGFVMTKGDLDLAAQRAMENIKSKFSRAWILGDLAASYHDMGETEQARKAVNFGLKTAQELKNPWARSRVLAKFGAVIHRLD